MLTKEQEQKIKEAADKIFWATEPPDITNSMFSAIVAAIKVYDELKNTEEVETMVEATNDSSSDAILLDEAIDRYLKETLYDDGRQSECLQLVKWLQELRVRRMKEVQLQNDD